MPDTCVHICQNGHFILTSMYIQGKEFCEKCGSEMMDKCPDCGAVICEWNYGGIVYLGTPHYDRASYCKNCGSPYPWTAKALEAAAELIEEEENLTAEQKEKLSGSLQDIICETPKTQVATVRIKKALLSVGRFTAEGLRQFVIDFGCELAQKQLGI